MLCVLLRILYPSIGGAPAYRACCSCITESFDDARVWARPSSRAASAPIKRTVYFSAGALPAAASSRSCFTFASGFSFSAVHASLAVA
jgi:hypothetical protein